MVLVAVVGSLPLVAAYVIRQVVLPQVEQRFGCQIAVRDIVVRPKTVRLVHVSVREQKGPSGTEPVRVRVVRVEYSPWSLFWGRVEVSGLTATRPLLQIVRGGEEDNISALLKRLRGGERTGQTGSGGRLRGPEQVIVTDGELDVRDELGQVHVRSLSAQLHKQGDRKSVV